MSGKFDLLRHETGAVVSAELALIVTVLVLAIILGLSEIAVSVNEELNDLSNAAGRLDQSYRYSGFRNAGAGRSQLLKDTSFAHGLENRDSNDDGDWNDSCDLVCEIGGSGISRSEANRAGPTAP